MQTNVAGLALMMMFGLQGQSLAQSCDREIGALTAALNAVSADYPSSRGKLSAPDIEVHARRLLPDSVGRDCVDAVERHFPDNVLRLTNGSLSFYTEAEHFKFGFRVDIAGEIATST
jgi:hypothetical protein